MRANLLKASTNFVNTFINSSAKFAVFRTVPETAPLPSATPTCTLFILDSSFNPPSLAHLILATSALRASRERYPGPRRLLLLFSVHNADKKAAPAPFEQRLAMMYRFAEDLSDRLSKSHPSQTPDPEEEEAIAIDVGLTKLPYYNDKTSAIEASTTDTDHYAGDPVHIHLTGYDTYTRIFAAKYYPNHDPPLSALDDFFDKHGLRVTIRADAEQGKDERGEWGSAQEQRHTIEKLGNGELEDVGGKRVWAEKVDITEGEEEGKGVSSTRVRKAVKVEDWTTVGRLCTPRVAEWVKEEGLYTTDG